VKNLQLGARTVADIGDQVTKVLRGLGNPEPPINLALVRELLRLDRQYYSTTDDGLLRETISRLKVAGRQVLLRPTLLKEAVQNLSLKALYLPDQKRILIDKDLPKLKHRWNEAHEVGHDIIPWHVGMMLGDTEQTLTPTCHAIMEAEANYAAGQLLFLAERFPSDANDAQPSVDHIRQLSRRFGNTMTSTLWRFVEQAHQGLPMVVATHRDSRPCLVWRRLGAKGGGYIAAGAASAKVGGSNLNSSPPTSSTRTPDSVPRGRPARCRAEIRAYCVPPE
jgi:hypothetical protein